MIPSALIIGLFLPLIGFAILVFFGRRIGEPGAGILASCLMTTSAVLALVAGSNWLLSNVSGAARLSLQIPWVFIGSRPVSLGIHVDSLTIVMFTMVAVVASAIFVYSIGYMHGDRLFSRFFAYLCLFGFSMLGLVVVDSLIGLFIFWELVGICSYFLIGFWFEKKSASDAAKKAFIVNRVGDFLFLVGIAVMFAVTGQMTLADIFDNVRAGAFAGQDSLLTFVGICLFFGAIGKSAQFPLHVWLPDAMEGPTPVSALIHAATMVAAGVYLVGRIFPILTPTALMFIAVIGVITLFGSALVAIVMTDIKRVLAYSTVSQLGYMILSLGVGGWVAGLFHLITHACFKALLFLGAGSVIHGCQGEQDIRKMGGLHRKMPITSITFLVATLAISGVPFFSGAYSKDAMLTAMLAFSWGQQAQWVFFILPAAGAAVTAFYMMRLYLLVFHTTARDKQVYEHAHESPKVMWLPLAFLAVLTLTIGWFGSLPHHPADAAGVGVANRGSGLIGLIADAQPRWTVSQEMAAARDIDPSKETGAAPDPGSSRLSPDAAHNRFHGAATVVAVSAMAIGFLIAFLTYGFGLISPERTAQRLRPVYTLLQNKFYFDELYRATVIAAVLRLVAIGKWFDRVVLDGLADGSARWLRHTAFFSGLTLDNKGVDGLVNGAAELAFAGGRLAVKGQTGRVRTYVLILAMLAAAVIFYIGIQHFI